MQEQEQLKFFELAHEGAFVRSVAGAVEAGIFQDLHGFHPRSVIVVCGDEVSRAAVELVAASYEPAQHPVVVAHQVPLFAGPLDVVLVVGERRCVEQSAAEASRRGCFTVCVCSEPWEEPPSGVILLPELPGMQGQRSPGRVAAALWAMLLSLDTPTPELVAATLMQCADAIDEELQTVAPQRDAVVNPARGLRNFVRDARVVHMSYSAPGARVAALVARLWVLNGLLSGCLSAPELEVAAPVLEGPEKDIFFDPFLDDPALDGELPAQQLLPLRVVAWVLPADQHKAPPAEALPPHIAVQQCDISQVAPVAAALILVVRAWAAAVFEPTTSIDT